MFLPRLRTSAYPLIWMLLLGEDALRPVFCPSELRKEHSKVFWCWMWLQWVGFLPFNKESAFFCLSTWAVILKFKKNQGSFFGVIYFGPIPPSLCELIFSKKDTTRYLLPICRFGSSFAWGKLPSYPSHFLLLHLLSASGMPVTLVRITSVLHGYHLSTNSSISSLFPLYLLRLAQASPLYF